MANLKGRVALVTGGSKGIGKATCQALARLGASVAINYAGDSASAEQLVQELGEEHAICIRADAGSIAGVERMVQATVDRFGRIDVVVANAGVLPMKDLANTTEIDFDRTYSLNVKGPYFLAQKASPHMAAGSSVIFISSSQCHASTVTPEYLLYCSTKGAIEQITKVLSKELAGKGISVNAVAPGPTATELFLKGKSEELLKAIASTNPHGKIGRPEDIADVIAFLGSQASRWVTGQILPVNGGSCSI